VKTIPGLQQKAIGKMKNRFSRWFDLTSPDKRLRKQLLTGVENVGEELAKRQDWYEVITTQIELNSTLSIRHEDSSGQVFASPNALWVTTITPGWAYGWRPILKNAEVYDTLTWFLHYARQYVNRSNIARVLMLAFNSCGEVLSPFASRSIQEKYHSEHPLPPVNVLFERIRNKNLSEFATVNESNAVSAQTDWLSRNTLDPLLHQSVFHFLRGQELLARDMTLEAVVAFDCSVQSILRLLNERCKQKITTRKGVCDALSLPHETSVVAEYAYFLRNQFGAHAGGWRWWDSAETIDSESCQDIGAVTLEILTKAADDEPSFRVYNPQPINWSDWFFEHFDMLWNTVWFERFADWQHQFDKPTI
jgi:hypothetical protein